MAPLPSWSGPLRRGFPLRKLQVTRGLRAGLAVAISTLVCHHLRIPIGWSALGAFECVIVDNGGPYRIRFQTIAVLLVGGGVGALLASLVTTHLAASLIATAVFCFAFTFLRAAGDPFTSSSIIVLVIFFVGLSHPASSLQLAAHQAQLFIAGGLGAAVLCLFLWPIFPFKPARMAIAKAYGVLVQLLAATQAESAATGSIQHSHELKIGELKIGELQNAMRRALEDARNALGNVRARAPARTIRAQSLAVLLETAEFFFGRAIALHGYLMLEAASASARLQMLSWMERTASLLEAALARQWSAAKINAEAADLLNAGLQPKGSQQGSLQQQEWLEAFQTAQNAAAASSSGVDPLFRMDRHGDGTDGHGGQKAEIDLRIGIGAKVELLRQNWTYQSSAWRHALRSAVVCTASVLLARLLHVAHGDWMSLTAVIVLQPWAAHTWRKSLQRVGGTVAGGVLAALLGAVVHSPFAIIAVVSLTSFFTLALFAVDYAWYSFFLTPTFVLLANPGQHSWSIASDRALDTVLGAALALAASKLLFVQPEHLELRRVFARVLTLHAEYLGRLSEYWTKYWSAAAAQRREAEKRLLIPGRRAVGLANNEAEESLDRLALELASDVSKGAPEATLMEHALAFTTYSRRLSQSTTMLVHVAPEDGTARLDRLRVRVQRLSEMLDRPAMDAGFSAAELPAGAAEPGMAMTPAPVTLALERMEAQVDVLERSAFSIVHAGKPTRA